jgi:predicted kinase
MKLENTIEIENMNLDKMNLTGKYSKEYKMNGRLDSIPPHLKNIYSKYPQEKDVGTTGKLEIEPYTVKCGVLPNDLIEGDWVTIPLGPSKLFYTIGCMRSGKSTFARQWEKEKTTPDEKRVVLSGDSFRKGVHGQIYIGEAEFFVFACMDAAARALIHEGYTVLIDETSSSINTIERYLRICIQAQPIWIDTPKEICITRAINLKQEYLIPAIERVSKQIEELKENFQEKINKIKQRIIDRKVNDYIPSVEPKGI